MKEKITCLILVGGLGTRLRAVVKNVPKPFACVNKRPFLEHLLFHLSSAGITDVVLCTGYKAQIIEKHFKKNDFGLSIRFSQEDNPRGTAGALRTAERFILSDPFMAMNGDCYCDVDIKKLIQQHERTHAVATIAAHWLDDCAGYGHLILDEHGRIREFREKKDSNCKGYINAGIYILNKSVLGMIPASGSSSLERDIFPRLIEQGMYAFKSEGPFVDIGTPEGLKKACDILPSCE